MPMYEVINTSGAPIKAWINGVPIEESARQQLVNVASLPFIHRHVAVMPDVHWGMGATVGSVIPTKGAIVPAAVGVDIGCGMIERRIPHGRTNNGGPGDRGAWHDIPTKAEAKMHFLADDLLQIFAKHPTLVKQWNVERAARHMGTLGT